MSYRKYCQRRRVVEHKGPFDYLSVMGQARLTRQLNFEPLPRLDFPLPPTSRVLNLLNFIAKRMGKRKFSSYSFELLLIRFGSQPDFEELGVGHRDLAQLGHRFAQVASGELRLSFRDKMH